MFVRTVNCRVGVSDLRRGYACVLIDLKVNSAAVFTADAVFDSASLAELGG